MRRRPLLVLAVAAGVVAFLAASLLTARVLSAGTAERDAVIEAVREDDRAPGELVVLRYDGPGLALGAGEGIARLAYRRGDALPRVVCAMVRRTGGLIAGFEVEVAALRRVGRQAGCGPGGPAG